VEIIIDYAQRRIPKLDEKGPVKDRSGRVIMEDGAAFQVTFVDDETKTSEVLCFTTTKNFLEFKKRVRGIQRLVEGTGLFTTTDLAYRENNQDLLKMTIYTKPPLNEEKDGREEKTGVQSPEGTGEPETPVL